jgi:hypothetical protein
LSTSEFRQSSLPGQFSRFASNRYRAENSHHLHQWQGNSYLSRSSDISTRFSFIGSTIEPAAHPAEPLQKNIGDQEQTAPGNELLIDNIMLHRYIRIES